MQKGFRRGLVIVLVLLGLGALAAPKIVSLSAARDEAAAPPPAARVLKVRTHAVRPELLVERLATTGTLRANEQVEITSEIAGKVVAILFDEGSRVDAGQVLVRIDDAELSAERQRIRHQLELAEIREARQRQLLDEGVQSQQDYDFALSQLNVLRSELQVLEAQLTKTEIRAPFAGTLGLRYVSLGSYLSPQTRIASLQDVDPIKVDFSVPEKYAAQVRLGGRISFRVGGTDGPFTGEVYAVEPSVERETRSLLLRARSPNPGGRLLPGAFADVEVVVREVAGALAVPNLAVIPELGGKKVFVYEDGKAQERRVETGIRSAEWIEVTTGLEPGDQVIVSAIQQLRPGLAVEPEVAEAQP
ncbi:MAG TPA: efflux RND transporter periplasmic adaptor subunit [Thermoanaerobaculia bacterium]